MARIDSASAFVERLESLRTDDQREKYRRYFKAGTGDYGEGDLFIGVPMGQVFSLAKDGIDLPLAEIEALMESPIHEARAGAMSVMDKQGRRKTTTDARRKELFELYLRRLDRINNWDLVDLGAPYVVGRHLFDRGDHEPLLGLARSDGLWERRTAITATSYHLRQGHVDPTFEIAEILVNDPHDLIHKSTGGWLRLAGDHDRPRLDGFLERHAATMPRVMLRFAIEHHDPDDRAGWLAHGKI